MFRRVLGCVLIALVLCLNAATDGAAASSPGESAQTTTTRYSVYSRKTDSDDWGDHRFFRTADEAAAAAGLLRDRGQEAQVHPWITMVRLPPRPKTCNRPRGETVTFPQAKQIFKYLASQRDIAFHYPNDGCYARAYLMTKRLQQRGYHPFKIWSFANGTSLHVSTTDDPQGYVEWLWHVAPVVRVRFENGVQCWYVMDPALFERPATVAEWRKKQKKPESRYTPYLTVTSLGQAPKDVHGNKLPGSGYWPGPDPRLGPEAYSIKKMREYKRKEGRRPRRGLSAVGLGDREEMFTSLVSMMDSDDAER